MDEGEITYSDEGNIGINKSNIFGGNKTWFPVNVPLTQPIIYIYIYLFIYLFIYILVGGFNPSETDKSQFGVLFPTEWDNQIHVPKHQTVFYSEFRAERCVS